MFNIHVQYWATGSCSLQKPHSTPLGCSSLVTSINPYQTSIKLIIPELAFRPSHLVMPHMWGITGLGVWLAYKILNNSPQSHRFLELIYSLTYSQLFTRYSIQK